MITKPTVFVLGAGASAVYTYPSGRGLLDEICTTAGPLNILKSTTSFGDNDINEFVQALWHSGQSSVDAFLEYQQQFTDIGKAAMAAVLVPKERERDLWHPLDNKNWMLYLYNQMSVAFEKFGEHKVSFITYNYDRTLDHFLMTSLCNMYGKSAEECRMIMPEIIHLHGRLGYLPWESPEGRAYGDTKLSADRMAHLIKDIKIVHEDPADGRDEDFRRALESMEAAERIYFVGFGWGRVNVERLQGKFAGKSQGTAYGLTNHEIDTIRQKISGVTFIQPELDCMRFMRNVINLD